MTRIFLVLALVGVASASGAERLRELRWIAAHAARAECRKPPIAEGGQYDAKLAYYDFRDTAPFLRALAPSLFAYDGRFASEAAALVDASPDADVVAIFTMNALAPWLESLGYFDLKRRYVEPALDNLACLDVAFGIKGLSTFKDIAVFQNAATRLSVAALRGAGLLMTKAQAERATWWTKFIEASPPLDAIRKELPAMRDFAAGLAPNPLLRARARTLTPLLDFISE